VERFFEKIYTGAAYVAGFFMICILVTVMASILGRFFNFDASGMDAYAGYSMAASSLFALAHTFRRGEHIRVTLFLQLLKPSANRVLDVFCHVVAIGIASALTWFSARLVWQSHVFHDVSTGLDATPLWIPQIGMALGALLLVCALIQDLVELLWNRPRIGRPATDGGPAHIE
jgi:TRAP-type C4-dicarboxylate transport system permease small subunit